MVLCFILTGLSAQDTTSHYKKRKLDPVKVDLLYGYYRQDGKHSPVTGGSGTEELENHSPTILVHIPIDSNKALSLDMGIDAYTSASTDNIDYRVSSASYKDVRSHAVIGYSQRFEKAGMEAGASGSFSIESDYLSRGLGLFITKEFEDGNSLLSLNSWFFFDIVGWGWLNPDYYSNVSIVYPVELRDTVWFDDGRRNTFSFSLAYTRNLTKRMNVALFTGFTYQEGLLSTSFHRVYFYDQDLPRVENLPRTRLKFPAGVRLNYFLSDLLVFRTYYRFYTDSWGINAHTASLEVPFKITSFLSAYPIYRFHYQRGTRYFAPYKEHTVQSEYYTSDYDLSGFTSNEIGAGVKYSPPLGLARFRISKKGRKTMLSRLELRYVYYLRSDELEAHAISVSVSFTGY